MSIKGHFSTGLVQDPGAIPLVIAVAGHRDPQPDKIEQLKETFRQHLRQLMAEVPYTPIILLNGLAAGMDSEAAEVFLEETRPEMIHDINKPNHQLVAVLPKPVNQYLQEDFPAHEAGQARLKKLLKRCSAILDPENCIDLIPEEEAHSEDNRFNRSQDRCYAKQSEFLVRHCYLLIAFFNGEDSLKAGGTGQTVAMQRGDIYPLFMHVNEVIAAREPGILIDIRTPRQSDKKSLADACKAYYWREMTDTNQTQANASLQAQTVNDLIKTSKVAKDLDKINKELLRYPPTRKYDSNLESSLWLYADAMANKQKKSYMRLCKFIMAGSIVVSLSISQQDWQAIGLLIVLSAVILFPKLQQGPKLEFIQWRCLAESLQVTDFWGAIQITTDTADLFHSQTNQNFGWIRTVLRGRRIQLLAIQSKPEGRPSFSDAMTCCARWIQGQERWLTHTINKQEKWNSAFTMLGLACFSLALGFAISYTIFKQSIPEVLAEGLIGIAVAVFGYKELIGYGDTNARYSRSRVQFSRGGKALSSVASSDVDNETLQWRQRLIVEAVGREKIDELNDWIGDQLQRVYRPA